MTLKKKKQNIWKKNCFTETQDVIIVVTCFNSSWGTGFQN